MLDAYLDILLALDEGDVTIPTIARATGRSEADTFDAVDALQRCGFVDHPGRVPSGTDAFGITPMGKRLLRVGYDELFRRTLAERLGGSPESAS